MAFGRTRSGKLSPRYTHGVGPQKTENENTCRTAKAMSVSPPCLLRTVSWSAGVPAGASVKWPTRPAMSAQTPSMIEPVRRDWGWGISGSQRYDDLVAHVTTSPGLDEVQRGDRADDGDTAKDRLDRVRVEAGTKGSIR